MAGGELGSTGNNTGMNYYPQPHSPVWRFDQFDRIALIQDSGISLTYQELHQYGQQIAGKIPERCLVFSLCSNSAGSIAGYTGFLNNRIVPLLLSSNMDMSLLKALIDTYLPAYIWAPQDMSSLLPGRAVFSALDYALIQTGFEKSYPLHPELGLLLTTSGSTGSPKLVRQSYHNIKSNMKAIVQCLGLNETERPITTLPMNYTYGLSIINSHLYCGATILLTSVPIFDKRFWDFFNKHQGTSFGGVPFTYEMLDKTGFFRLNLPTLRTMTQAGGKLPVELQKKFVAWANNNGVRFVVMYGATEATARMSYLPPDKAAEKPGSIGIPIPGGKFFLLDENGLVITEPGQPGTLVYEGDNVTLGYAECGEDLIKGDENCGRLETGDVARFDEDGYFYIVGRKKRFLKIFGNRINLDEVEKLIDTRCGHVDCACAGTDERLYVFITDDAHKPEIDRLLFEKVGLNRATYRIVKLDSIPRNDAGKVLYSQLSQYCEGEKS